MYGCSKKPFSWNLHIPLFFFPAFIFTKLNDRPHTPQFRRQMWSCLSACCEMPLLADTREPSKHYFWTTTKTSYYNTPELFHWAKLWFLILKNCSCQIFEDFVTQAMDQIHPVHCHHHGDPSRDITGSLFSSSSLNRAITMTGPWDHMGWPTYVHWQKTNSRKESDTTDIVFLQSLLCQLCNPRDHLSKRKRALPVHLIENRKRKLDAFLFLLRIASLSFEHNLNIYTKQTRIGLQHC